MKTKIVLALPAAASLGLDALAETSIPASPEWVRAMPQGTDPRVRITLEYAKHVARDAYFWGVADAEHLQPAAVLHEREGSQ